MMMDFLAQISDTVGIVGVILLLAAYYALNTNRMSSQNLKYQLLNLTGAILIMYSLMFHWNTASVLIECAWILISLIGIYRAKTASKNPICSNMYYLKHTKKR